MVVNLCLIKAQKRLKQYQKEYRLKNKKRINEYLKEWVQNNRDRSRKHKTKWRLKNKNYWVVWKNSNVNNRISHNLRSRVRVALKGIVKSKKKPKYSLDAHVEKIVDNKIYFLSICKTKNEIIRIYSSRVILAAGILENIRLLNSLVNKKLKVILNDHEWYNLGFIKTDEAISKNFIKKKFFFIFRDKLLVKKIEKVDLIIEFRPYSQIQLNNESFKFYSDIKNNIFSKIINNFSFSRINEAFFNKFGFSLFTDQVILSALLNNKNSITNNFKSIKKKRLSKKTLQIIAQKIKLEFKSLVILNKNETFDSQHINGGEKILKETKIKNLIKSNKIYIAGFPHKINNRNFYPTKFFIEKEKNN
jgi:hypothetical protein